MANIAAPGPGEYADFYRTYVSKVPEGDVLETLERQLEETSALLAGVSEERAALRYAPGKWSVKQVVGHLADAERMFSFRALAFARADPGPLPGMDQETYMGSAPFDHQSLAALRDELACVRRASLALFRGFDEAATLRRGKASGFELTVRALVYIVAGHERHHLEILRERYLAAGER